MLNDDQFIDVFHAGRKIDPPHLVPHPDSHLQPTNDPTFHEALTRTDVPDGVHLGSVTYGEIPWNSKELTTTGDYVSSTMDRRFSDKTIFTGTPHSVGAVHADFVHHYRVPKSSISAEIYGDDDITIAPSRSSGDRPTLWESIPLRRSQVHKMGKVVQMRNAMEGPGEISHVIPKDSFDKLGIQFVGTYRAQDWADKYRDQIDNMSPDNAVKMDQDRYFNDRLAAVKAKISRRTTSEPKRQEVPGQLQMDI